MKDRKIVYILIPVVIIVWGIIFFRIYKSIHSKENNISNLQSLLIDTMKTNMDTFKIYANYRDPFLGFIASKPADVTFKPAPIKKPVKQWPKIVYHGVIKGNNTNKKSALVEINDQSYILKEGEIINDIQLEKIFTDSIELVLEKDKKTIKR